MRPTDSELDELLDSAEQFAREAARILLQRADNIDRVDFKGRTDLVTDVDRQSEEVLLRAIHRQYPDHNILAEESGTQEQKSAYTWIIDPLDGTTNYVHGYPAWAVSVAVAYREQPVAGVVIELPDHRVYRARTGGGAQCDSAPISVSAPKNLQSSLLVTGFGYEHGDRWQKNMLLFRRLTDLTQGVRRLGSAAIDCCHAARGWVDGYWELDIKPWDIAAGVVIAAEAGASLWTPGSDSLSVYTGNLVMASPSIFPDLKQIIAEVCTEDQSV